jgi:hypothetical protein
VWDLLDVEGCRVGGWGNMGYVPGRTIPFTEFTLSVALEGGYRSIMYGGSLGLN